MKRIKKYIIPILIVAGLLLIITLTLSRNKQKLDAKAEIGSTKTLVFPVTITSPQYQTLTGSYTSNGFFIPVNSMALTSDISGRITATALKDGAMIRKGQNIVSVYNEAESIERQQNAIDRQLALETLQKAKTDLAKMENMLKANAITSREVEEQRLTVTSAEAKLSTINSIRKSTTITAPISGTVHKSYVQTGSYLSTGTVLADIVDNSSLKLQIPLLDKDVIKLSIGKKIEVVPDLYPDYKVTGTVVYIAAQADANRNFMVEVQIPNSTKKPLKAGMSGSAIISNDHAQDVLMIPVKTIVGSLLDPQVYVLKGEKAVLKKITTGYVQGDKVVVLVGLSETDKIIETGQLNINDGSTVQVLK
ncbi:MAG: efflux RND transporter periplasmic adaptor subunit [Lutibacter sp.]